MRGQKGIIADGTDSHLGKTVLPQGACDRLREVPRRIGDKAEDDAPGGRQRPAGVSYRGGCAIERSDPGDDRKIRGMFVRPDAGTQHDSLPCALAQQLAHEFQRLVADDDGMCASQLAGQLQQRGVGIDWRCLHGALH